MDGGRFGVSMFDKIPLVLEIRISQHLPAYFKEVAGLPYACVPGHERMGSDPTGP
jgi:hypothetical protein